MVQTLAHTLRMKEVPVAEDQANSFESQQRYFRQYIEHNPDWELYGIFADV